MSSDEEQDPAPRQGLPISVLPPNLRASARALVAEVDADGDGFLDEGELATILNNLKDTRKQNRSLIKLAGGLAGASLLLTGAVFGSSIAAAHLSKDTSVDEGGVLHAKGTGAVVSTSEAMTWSASKKFADMTNGELMRLRDIAELDGDLHFKVKGYARPPEEEGRVVLLVEGGTITYDADGMADATGDARDLIGIAFGKGDVFERALIMDATIADPEYNCRRLVKGHTGIQRNLCGGGGGGGNFPPPSPGPPSPGPPSPTPAPSGTAFSVTPSPAVPDWCCPGIGLVQACGC